MIICYDHFMLVQFAHVRIRQNDYSLELSSLGRPEANLGNPVQGCAQDVAQAASMQPARSSSLGSFSCPYSPKCLEVEFSEVRGSKQPLKRSGKLSTTRWWHPFSVETLRLGSSSCTIVYQGVATCNSATTREILAHRTGTQPNFAFTEFYEVRRP